MRVLVTGGAGFVGSHITDLLLARGHEVHVLDDLSTGRRENVAERAVFHLGDLRDRAGVDALVKELRPEVITHQGAQTSVSVSTREPHRDAEINIIGTLNVLEAAVRADVQRVVFASTGGAIYGEVAEGARAAVGHPTHPISPYACSKLAAEAYLGCYRAMHGLPYTVLRYANVYGPRQDPHGEAGVVAIFTERLLRGEPIQVNARREAGDEGCVRDYVYVSDVAEANRMAIEGELDAPIVNVCSGVPTTTGSLARDLAVSAGVTPTIRPGDVRAGDLERSVLDPASCPIAEPVELREGLDRTVAWFEAR